MWKALLFAAFLPLTLRTRLRFEGMALTMVLSVSVIVIGGAIKTLASGGGYGELKLLVNDNTGLYEGSTLSMVAVALIPLIIWLARYGTVFPPGKRVGILWPRVSLGELDQSVHIRIDLLKSPREVLGLRAPGDCHSSDDHRHGPKQTT